MKKSIPFALASIYAFRMLGLFMVLPVFSLYTNTLVAATPFLIGLALGIYGLTQALFQIPLAMISDRIGRKPIIIGGLILFIVGSVVAAMSHTIYGMILGRALQGAGAIGSTIMALAADLTPEEQRLKVMAVIGLTIGFSFMLAMLLGPIINGWFKLSGIFWLTAMLATGGIFILYLVPTPKRLVFHRDSETVIGQFKKTLLAPQLARLDWGIFSLHAMLMALFLVIPNLLLRNGYTAEQQWMIYLPVLIIAALAMLPFVIIAEKKRLLKTFFVGAIAVLVVINLSLNFVTTHIVLLSIALCLFFTAFTFLEACLPSLISKISPIGNKGTAMGIYSTAQFLGIFVGGSVGGWILNHIGINGVFLFCIVLGSLWLLLAITMQEPLYLSSKILPFHADLSLQEANAIEQRLAAIAGIEEVLVDINEKVIYLKVDKLVFKEASIDFL